MNILDAALGHYEVVGNPEDADFIVGHSFGTITEPGSANDQLADFVMEYAAGRPIVADRMLVNAIPNGDETVSLAVEGPISNAIGKGVGTWGVLIETRDYMQREGLHTPLMIAHAHHIGRVVMQANKLDIQSIVPANLPSKFDAASKQWGTRSPALWVVHEVLGSVELRRRGQL